MITLDLFNLIVFRLGQKGRQDIYWAESLTPPVSAEVFALETIYVICNSGMKNKVAVGIYERCKTAVIAGTPVVDVFRHKGKAAAIEKIWMDRARLFAGFMAAEDKVAFAATIPWIGQITKYHLAKNFGADVAKPDVHLQRLADLEKTTAQALCERLAKATGYRVATVDTLLWRACAEGIVNSNTGTLREAA